MSFGAHLNAEVVPLSSKLPRRRSGQSTAPARPVRHQSQVAAPVPPAWGCSAAGARTALTSAHAGASDWHNGLVRCAQDATGCGRASAGAVSLGCVTTALDLVSQAQVVLLCPQNMSGTPNLCMPSGYDIFINIYHIYFHSMKGHMAESCLQSACITCPSWCQQQDSCGSQIRFRGPRQNHKRS